MLWFAHMNPSTKIDLNLAPGSNGLEAVLSARTSRAALEESIAKLAVGTPDSDKAAFLLAAQLMNFSVRLELNDLLTIVKVFEQGQCVWFLFSLFFFVIFIIIIFSA